jgi:hypothetical protein
MMVEEWGPRELPCTPDGRSGWPLQLSSLSRREGNTEFLKEKCVLIG